MGDTVSKRLRVAVPWASPSSHSSRTELPATLWAVILFDCLSIRERAVLRRVDKSWSERLKRAAAVATTLTVQPNEWHYPMGDLPRCPQRLTLHVDYFTGRPPDTVMSRSTLRHLRIHCTNPHGFWSKNELSHAHKPWPRLESLHIRVGCGTAGIVDTPDRLTENMPNLREFRLLGTSPMVWTGIEQHQWPMCIGDQWKSLRVLELPWDFQHDSAIAWKPLVQATPKLEELTLRSCSGGEVELTDKAVDMWIQGWPRMVHFTWTVKPFITVHLSEAQIQRAIHWTRLDLHFECAWLGSYAEYDSAARQWGGDVNGCPTELTSAGGLQRLPVVE